MNEELILNFIKNYRAKLVEDLAADIIMYVTTRMLLDQNLVPPLMDDIKEAYDRMDKEIGHVYDEIIGPSFIKK